jgi:hypothetical protein
MCDRDRARKPPAKPPFVALQVAPQTRRRPLEARQAYPTSTLIELNSDFVLRG